jgi:tRNA uridine 5-carbamoylmethylation protein Kti12
MEQKIKVTATGPPMSGKTITLKSMQKELEKQGFECKISTRGKDEFLTARKKIQVKK